MTQPNPPRAAQRDHHTTWHGEDVADPWFWLRDKTDPEVIAYLDAENAYTTAQTTEVRAFGDTLYAEMLGRIQQTDLGVPERRGSFDYYSRTQEGQQYPIHCRKRADEPAAPEQIVLDQNELAAGLPFFSLGAFAIADDEHQLLYSTDTTGFRQYTLFVKDLRTGASSPALAARVTSVAWMADSRHVVYGTEDETTKRSDHLWRLDLHGPGAPGEPALLAHEPDEHYRIGVGRTRDKRYLVCVARSTNTWESGLLATTDTTGTFRTVLPRETGHKYSIDHRDGQLFILTNRDAKNFKLVTAPVDAPTAWTELIPHRDDTLIADLDLYRDHLVVEEQRDALVAFRIYAFATQTWLAIAFPEPVYFATGMGAYEWSSPTFRISYQSMVTPSTVYDAQLADGELILRKQTAVLGGYAPADYVTERRWVVARDGARVPLSLLYKRGTPLDAGGPCFLYGYGSYGIGMPATFSIARLSLVDRGMIYVIAHIRGGNELGEAWHDAGMLQHKLNTFHDFIDVGDALVASKLTAPATLVIEGGSAGGLLMGAVINMRPDLFAAVHAAVPFVDVLNTMFDTSLPLTVGEYLEWGDPNDPDAFALMRRYSPYDNVGAHAYPALLVTTSINDSQVMYWEPAKWVAKLRATQTGTKPLLLKCNMDAGHGGASGRYDRLKEVSFEYAWLMTQVGITK